jgi:hypothetical protein
MTGLVAPVSVFDDNLPGVPAAGEGDTVVRLRRRQRPFTLDLVPARNVHRNQAYTIIYESTPSRNRTSAGRGHRLPVSSTAQLVRKMVQHSPPPFPWTCL